MSIDLETDILISPSARDDIYLKIRQQTALQHIVGNSEYTGAVETRWLNGTIKRPAFKSAARREWIADPLRCDLVKGYSGNATWFLNKGQRSGKVKLD